MSAASAARHNRHQMHSVASFQKLADDGVTRLVAGDQPLILVADDMALLFGAHLNALNRVIQVAHGNLLLAFTGTENRRFIHDVFQIRAGEIRRALGNVVQIDVIGKRLFLGMNTQNRLASANIRIANRDLAIKTTRAQKRGIQNILAVRRCQNNDALVDRKAIHLNEQLVERLLALIVSAAETAASLAADSVDLIDEDDRRGDLLCLLEQVAHTTRADADIELDKVRARN